MESGEREFLGQGWAFPVRLETDAAIAMAAADDSISQSIWMILATAPGERVMRPDFGCGIHDLVFAVNDATTASRVTADVRRALMQWEPRIDILDVAAAVDQQDPSQLLIRIEYRVRATNNRFNLVYPFYLEY